MVSRKRLFMRAANFVRNYSTDKYVRMHLTKNESTGIATIELDKPPVNYLSFSMLRQLTEAVSHVEYQKGKGLIITSKTDGAFSAGLDPKELHKPHIERLFNYLRILHNLWYQLYTSSTPTVAVVNGPAIAGGCFLALSCEYRVMLPGFQTGTNEVTHGIPVPPMFVACLKSTLGHGLAEKALLEGRLFTSEKALEVGLVDEIVQSKSAGIARAEEYLRGLGEMSGQGRKITKWYLRHWSMRNLEKHREMDIRKLVEVIKSKSCQDALGELLKSESEK